MLIAGFRSATRTESMAISKFITNAEEFAGS